MRFISLILDGKTVSNQEDISRLLTTRGFGWLLKCEFANAKVEVKNDVLIWHAGIFYWGYWCWGVFAGGDWRSGHWMGGIWQNGIWRRGTWHNGVWKGGEWRGGDWVRGKGRE